MAEWLVNVVLIPAQRRDVLPTSLVEAFADVGSMPAVLLVEGERVEVAAVVQAPTAVDAASNAVSSVQVPMADLYGGGEVVGVRASTADEAERLLRQGEIPKLIDTEAADQQLAGLSETAELLDVSRSRVAALRMRADFPRPVAELASGPVWVEREIEAFARRWERQAGRPPQRPGYRPAGA